MNSSIRIGVVEDELLIAETICMQLKDIGYETGEVAINYQEAIEMLHNDKPDLVLLDVQLGIGQGGIEVAMYIREHFQIPFIFLTANSDANTLERAKQVHPSAYIVKPFTKEDLFTSIEIALVNSNHPIRSITQPQITGESEVKDFLFVKEGHVFKKLMFEDIFYLESDGNYVNVFLSNNRKYILRDKLDNLAERLQHQKMLRIHRSYVVCLNKIDEVFPTEISIGSNKLPLGKTYRSELMKLLGIAE